MKEVFLFHIWQFQKFKTNGLKTTCGKSLTVLKAGNLQTQSGPDFFNAQIILDDQKWAGNIEIHVKSSDWYVHHHNQDDRYDSIILHVVWEHDVDVFRKNETSVPVLELKSIVDQAFINNYQYLMQPKSWLFCEKDIKNTPSFQMNAWLERLFFERLESKSKQIDELLYHSKSDWEAVLFILLAKNFGSKANGNALMQMAQSIDFSIIRKEANQNQGLESLFFGRLGLLDQTFQENYPTDLQTNWHYQKVKYQLETIYLPQVQFFKVRPDNFPTLRLAQLAQLYQTQKQLFQDLIVSDNFDHVFKTFDIQISNYWKSHYRFELESPAKIKKISKSFVENILINTIIPLKFAYYKQNSQWDQMDQLIEMMQKLMPEKNNVTDKFMQFGVSNKNAFDSQALLHLKSNYCDAQKCLNCAVGTWLLSHK